MDKKWKNQKMIKKWQKNGKIAIFHFFENFCTTGSKNDKNMINKWKNDKK